jgi:hypothetical protein
MSDKWPVVKQFESQGNDEDLKMIFGEDARVTRIGKFNLIHLDNPDPVELARRIEEFDPDEIFEDDCPLCKMLREQGGNVVYDDSF